MIAKSLYTKLTLVLLALLLLVGITFIIVSIYTTEMYQQEVSQRLNHELAKLIVSERLLIKQGGIDENSLKDIFHMLMVVNPSIEVYLLDPEGDILAFSAPSEKVKRTKVNLEPIKLFLDGGSVLPLLGDDPRNVEGEKVFTVARIPEDGPLEGYLYVILGGEMYDNIIQKLQGSYIFRLGIWGIIASLVIAVLTGLIVFALLTKRLRLLAAAMDDYSEGTTLNRISLPPARDSSSGDEIDRLVITFQQMAARIEEQVESLKQVDSLRRQLVANVSHDLRTPLATLQGYLETLLMKEEELSREEKQHYIDIAIRHCKRLNSLVADFFELAKLEARDTEAHPEPFNLKELVQDIVQKFRLGADEKKVRIQTNLERELPFVHADIALIERALENLIENALRHTPEEGSVSIILSQQDDHISVSVSDTGLGIPAEDLPHIFEQFHQLGKSRKDKSGHSGLGLAITKRILQLHGSDIEVESRVNVGTTFTFRLPAYHA